MIVKEILIVMRIVMGPMLQYSKTISGGNHYADPCTDEPQCLGDFDCDQDCDGTDATLFKADFGSSQYINPCPPCTLATGAVY